MQLRDIAQFVEGTSDPAFAVNGEGRITAWNTAASELFGIPSEEAKKMFCGDIIQGRDECGTVCQEECLVKQAAEKRRPMRNFDLQVETKEGKKWCNLSVSVIETALSAIPYTVHILRMIDSRKRFEMLVRDFVVSETSLPEEYALELLTCTRSPTREATLTGREVEILRYASQGSNSQKIAGLLHLSPATVDNHFQHILKKLNAHSRLEAIRKAQLARLF